MKRPVDLPLLFVGGLFLTSSFDVFLSLNLGPNIRAAQLCILGLLAVALPARCLGLTFKLPLGGVALLLWCGVQIAFIPVVSFWQKSAAYAIWLVLNVALIFAMTSLYSEDEKRLRALLNWYLYSFVFVACFGLIQFALPLVGGPGLLVSEWWIEGKVARINGFNYEPSYFATYMIMGVVSLSSLRRAGLELYRTRRWSICYFLMALAIFLSSSRMGIVFLILDLSTDPVKRFLLGRWRPINLLRTRVSSKRILIAATSALLIAVAVKSGLLWYRDNTEVVELLLNGTGLLGTASHSVDDRGSAFHDTIQIIVDHPWIGRSLGGLTEAVAGYHGAVPQTFAETKDFEGLNVFAEVMAASGIVGFIPFLWFIAVTIYEPLKLARRCSPYYAAWLRALTLGLIFEWGMLQFSPTILRIYLWTHIAVLATVYAAARRQFGPSAKLARSLLEPAAHPGI